MELNEIRNRFSANTKADQRDVIYETIYNGTQKFDSDRTFGRPKFIIGHTYKYVSDQLSFFKDSNNVEHPFIEVTFIDVNTGIELRTSISFWRKIVPQAIGPAKGNTYEKTVCVGLGSSDKEVLNNLRGGITFQCDDRRLVSSGLQFQESTQSWVGKLDSQTWVYSFTVK